MLSVATICLAMNIYHESRGEPLIGQYAVAHVTMNRVESEKHPNDVCGVVFKKGAFHWTADKRSVEIAAKKMKKQLELESWSMSVLIAKNVLAGRSKDITRGALFFNEKSMGRRFKTNVPTLKISSHIFY